MLTKSKSKQILKLKYVLLIPIVFGMLLYTSSNAQEKVPKEEVKEVKEELSEFLIVIEKENNEIKLTCQEGCAWKELSFTLFENKPQAIDQYGMTTFPRDVLKEDSKLSNFLFTLSKVENVLKLEGKEGTAWIDLSFSCLKDNCKGAISQYGVTSFGKEFEKERKKIINALSKMIKNRDIEVLDKKDFTNSLEIPFAVIDEVPVFPGCETISTNAERRICTSERIIKHISKSLNPDLAKGLGLNGMHRINVIFKIDKDGNVTGVRSRTPYPDFEIDKDGNVTGVRSRAPHPDLEAEAIRVIKTLPKFIPGKHQGKNVIVQYSLPIVFQVADEKD